MLHRQVSHPIFPECHATFPPIDAGVLSQFYEQLSPWVLVLRKWSDGLRPSGEFRCFCAAGGTLLAACQRDPSGKFEGVQARRVEIITSLKEFCALELAPRWSSLVPSLAPLAWDAYIDVDGAVHVIDLAPFHETTDPLLFSWEELRELAAADDGASGGSPELRLVGQGVAEGGIAPSARIYHGWPKELRELQGADVKELVGSAKRAAQA